MKYELQIDIRCPAENVLNTLINPKYFKHWQRGFISITPLSGKAGEAGAKSLLKYKMGNRNLEMTETLNKINLPEEIHVSYQANGVYNIQENYFTVTEEGTRWRSVSEFKFNSIFMKVMGFFMPGAFKKQSLQYMQDFKKFMETGSTVADEYD